MSLQSAVELALAAAALALLGRDLYRAWRDKLRRPMTLLVAGLMVVLLAGIVGGREHPHPWWLAVPAAILGWEVARGWRRTPRCHLWEAGIGAFAFGLALAALGLTVQSMLLVPAVAASIVGFALLWLSRRREPRPWRMDDVSHYERRAVPRTKAPDAS
ncbi:MAG: hypothetical protein E6H63_13615 [Betaproteobacteria bacterium]|nr:MAG: hypothetical protein E6H63_13615 [Betaproteobacteria bacterium]TMH46075.1 MAG: hypothetical protein E6H54_03660 [Betaproteobacteria bacterium]